MTNQEELTLLETAYTTLLGGGVQSYSINGRSVTRLDFSWMIKRIDQLRAAVARETTGGWFAGQFRDPE
jgi:hypothetical protein